MGWSEGLGEFDIHSRLRSATHQLQVIAVGPLDTDQPQQLARYHGPMSPHVSIDRDALSAFCRRHHITRLALFGSVLRDDFRPDSDVDVLVEFQAGHVPGLNFISIEREFSELLHGRRVDMVTPKFLNARIRELVLSSAEPLYVAA